MLQVQQDAHDRETVASMSQRLAIQLRHLSLSASRQRERVRVLCAHTNPCTRRQHAHLQFARLHISLCNRTHKAPPLVDTSVCPEVWHPWRGTRAAWWFRLASGKDSMTRISSPCRAMAELKSLTTT
jgi:hypothetical protein